MASSLDHFGAPLDLAVEPFDGVGCMEFRPMGSGEAHIGEHVGFGIVHYRGELGRSLALTSPIVATCPMALLRISRGIGCGSWRRAAHGISIGR